jgi:hypothetical protein
LASFAVKNVFLCAFVPLCDASSCFAPQNVARTGFA